jgi:outer membrane protein OmpA-like peptidoglycan-associated protein
MNNRNVCRTTGLLVAISVATILSGCASTPEAPAGSREVRNKLTVLKSDSALASQVPVAIEQTEAAVKLAETPQSDAALAAHRIYMADHMVDTTRATAETRLAESERAAISQQGDANRLAARTQEANNARDAATMARADATQARDEANSAQMAAQRARSDADAARAATAASTAAAEVNRQELAEQIALLQARATDRGLVLTLGDVLFATGSANLKPGAIGNLDRLVTFLNKYPDRTAVIEGHTDSMGSDVYNQDLSLRRADSVRGYIASNGVSSTRLTSVGKGESEPVASNDSAAGRQQNRRVEIVIGNDTQGATAAR